MAKRLVVDPVTRIEGHLRLEATLDGSNTITEAFSSGTMVRGIEKILIGRDPREAWAIAQRVCGVCTLVHAIASVRAVEDALGVRIPRAATIMRNMMIAQQFVHDHVMHFYHLHALDWVDVVSALSADPAATAGLQKDLSSWHNNSAAYFADVKAKLKGLADSGNLSLFGNAYWGHPGYKLPPEVNLLAVAHYLEALDWQIDATRVHVVLGGKNPHPDFVVGGVPMPIDMKSRDALNKSRLDAMKRSIDNMVAFVDQVYLPDALAVASFYKEYAQVGGGTQDFLTWGEFPGDDPAHPARMLVPRGLIRDRDLSGLTEPSPRDAQRLKEFVAHSWYDYSAGDSAGLHPFAGQTSFDYTGPEPPYDQLNVDGKYSWLKSPRWDGLAAEVGPLSRVLVMYASGHAQTRDLVDSSLARLGLPQQALFSSLGRTLARAIETKVFVDALSRYHRDLLATIRAGKTDTFNKKKWNPATWPTTARGVGTTEAPRGALGHWVTIKKRKIAGYQMVVPTTWNASPRDAAGTPGPYEEALKGVQLAVPDQPLEILRVVHSFDPCMGCAVHVTDADGAELGEARTGLNVSLR
jgi:hydrogenase large subunit